MTLPIHGTLNPSRYFACLLLLCYGGGALCLFASQAPWGLKWAAWVVATLILGRCLLQCVWRKRLDAVTEIRVDSTDWVWLGTWRGEFFSACLLADSFVSAHFVVLNFRLEKKSCIVSLVLFPDAIDPVVFRRLKAHLVSKKIA